MKNLVWMNMYLYEGRIIVKVGAPDYMEKKTFDPEKATLVDIFNEIEKDIEYLRKYEELVDKCKRWISEWVDARIKELGVDVISMTEINEIIEYYAIKTSKQALGLDGE